MKNSGSYSQYLKQENELTKLKIQAEFGFQVAGESSLNPAIENIWLKQILDYERAMTTNKKITVAEKLGYPVFRPFEEIPADELQGELHFVMETLREKNLVLDTVAGASDEDIYKFITRELLQEETDSNTPPNMLTVFIYEEFHPNHEYDIRNRGEEFMNALERTDIDFSHVISEESNDEAHMVKFEQLKRKLELFRQAFDKVEAKVYEVLSVNITDETAEILFRYNLSVLPVESRTPYELSGEGKFILKYIYEWWGIVEVKMEGIG
jgi:hypothetical protein